MRIFKIVLDRPKLAYTSGDVLTGHVVLESSEDEAVGSIMITFSGRGKTKLHRRNGNSHRIYRGRAPLFNQTKTLYRGYYTLRAERYSWPFEFTFPTQSDPKCSEDSFGPGNLPFTGTAYVHPLPPSFNMYGGSARNQGKVEYKLEARLNRPNGSSLFGSGHLETELTLRYLPRRVSEDIDYCMRTTNYPCTARSLRLLPNKPDLTLKEKLYSLFNASDLPWASFSLRLTYPTQTYAQGPLPLHLSVVNMKTSDDVHEAMPPIYLRALSVEVKSYFTFRAKTSFNNDITGEVTEKDHLVEFANALIPIPVVVQDETNNISGSSGQQQEPLDLATLAPAATVADASRRPVLRTPALGPSFSTVNVAASYKLKLRTRVVCAGKEFRFDVSAPLTVLSPIYSVGPQQQQQLEVQNGAGLGAPRVRPGTEEALPRYEKLGNGEAEAGPSEGPPAYEQAAERRGELGMQQGKGVDRGNGGYYVVGA